MTSSQNYYGNRLIRGRLQLESTTLSRNHSPNTKFDRKLSIKAGTNGKKAPNVFASARILNLATHIGAGWMKWKLGTALKVKFKVVVRQLCCMAECWSMKNSHIKKMRVAEMRMLRWMYEFTRRDRISNETIQHKVGVALVADKIKEMRPRW
ncbi:hypothetical protein H5410_025855 [Solanum commersonii]|uniref:Uncharacterized protein n=1 Tax=Solanum commersonii TaxID=4109 RepID=A0A9J5YUD0_SOLCO|nr:hypothetical protein H5410_025855 [Solanum commersonii]